MTSIYVILTLQQNLRYRPQRGRTCDYIDIILILLLLHCPRRSLSHAIAAVIYTYMSLYCYYNIEDEVSIYLVRFYLYFARVIRSDNRNRRRSVVYIIYIMYTLRRVFNVMNYCHCYCRRGCRCCYNII